MNTMTITNIQYFPHVEQHLFGDGSYTESLSYSANITINDAFLVQISGNENEAHPVYIPSANEQYWHSGDNDDIKTQEQAEQLQDKMFQELAVADIEQLLAKQGIENNHDWLKANANDNF